MCVNNTLALKILENFRGYFSKYSIPFVHYENTIISIRTERYLAVIQTNQMSELNPWSKTGTGTVFIAKILTLQ